jgi:hypothetical protein
LRLYANILRVSIVQRSHGKHWSRRWTKYKMLFCQSLLAKGES